MRHGEMMNQPEIGFERALFTATRVMGHRSHFTACLPCILRGVVLNKKPLFRLACD